MNRPCSLVLLAAVFTTFAAPSRADDWPMWRCDAARSASTAEQLPAELHLRWSRRLPRLEPAWPAQEALQFDTHYQPIVLGQRLFVGSSKTDSITAYALETGNELWRFTTDGPVRFAPVAHDGKVYVGSDDGFLYCLNAEDGSLLWKRRGGPSDRRVLGNERLISTWPVRGAPVLVEGTLYFAAGIWPFMGTFLHALDAETGKVLWTNDAAGSMYISQPHNSPAFAGVTPQGYLAVGDDRLFVPNGRATPASFDRRSGRFQYFHHALAKRSGGFGVAASGRFYFAGGTLHENNTGIGALTLPARELPVIDGDRIFTAGNSVEALDLAKPSIKIVTDRKGRKVPSVTLKKFWKLDVSGIVRIQAGSRLYATADKQIKVVELPADQETTPTVVTTFDVPETPRVLVAANGHLIAVSREGTIYCYGGQAIDGLRHHQLPAAREPAKPSSQAQRIVAETGVQAGYCAVLGLDNGSLVEGLLDSTDLRIVVVDADASKVARLRRRVSDDGQYGSRVALHVSDPLLFDLPPYLFSLITSENIQAAGFGATEPFVKHAFPALRPYGGTLCLQLSGKQHLALDTSSGMAKLANAQVTRSQDVSLLKRVGALPGSADWTHQYADVANSDVSRDVRVKAPLGLLWFGGSTNTAILPRHGHGPTEQIVGGRLFIEGPDILRAMDIYTGRVLWEKSLPEIGKAFEYTGHQPGANSIGSNYASAEDGIYVAHGDHALRLDPATGKTLAEFRLPAANGNTKPRWGYIGLYEDLLIAGGSPIVLAEPDPKKKTVIAPGGYTQDGTTSRQIVVMNRYSGKVLWTADARLGWRHNTIVVGAGKLFAIDRLPDSMLKTLSRRGARPEGEPRLVAFDVRTGKPQWEHAKNVFGTWLSYSQEFDTLLQAGRPSRDMVSEEVSNRMATYRGDDGKPVWDKPLSYSGPCMLHHDRIITQTRAFRLGTGEPVERKNPLTGKDEPWTYSRNYGCNSAVASEHLLTFRSAAAGFFDLLNDSGTGNMGGFKSSCTSNLIVAGGLLNAPDYTRTCSCAYQNQTSLALVHMPDVESWTFNNLKLDEKDTIKRLGLNFGAPGDRKSDDGTLWLEYPFVGGPSPNVEIKAKPAAPRWFARHSSRIEHGEHPWISASGVEGLDTLSVRLTRETQSRRRYTVSLHFAEPQAVAPGDRVFSVALQGKTVLDKLDVAAQAQGSNRTIVKRIAHVSVTDVLTLRLIPHSGKPPILCGLEVVAEDD